ncbi:MAG: sialate O-acetylesterase [Planctomycetota bacterium]|nr:sialate O-acetylesterase [Planctomycetota bacterium]
MLNHARIIRRDLLTRITLSCSGLLICAAKATAADETPQITIPPKQHFHLFLMVGQSNMAGRGRVTEADRQPLPKVLVYSKNQRWIAARAPLHFDKPNVVGVGIGRAFAEALRQANPKCTVGLIPCAVGGSPISAWQPGGFHPSTKTHPWDDMLRRARAALPAGTLKGILWHQGESDCQPALAARYQDRLQALIQRFRHELQAPTVPFLAGQMGQFPERPWDAAKKRVDAAHRALPGNVAHTAFVSSHGLTHKGDEVHFDAKSYRQLGRRYAHAWLKLHDRAP